MRFLGPTQSNLRGRQIVPPRIVISVDEVLYGHCPPDANVDSYLLVQMSPDEFQTWRASHPGMVIQLPSNMKIEQ